ncbi:T9SS type A sorting domain-containing protein [Hymenobacter sp. DH14]|uniref:T9SS type A sorting domain-containing protein n=1 Tax=Hymenobacter cyanobacteriorum TaxID=2926463 RepID=A0A9X2AH82_9BACT|nr:T9SS type A sorting domain-containing protein [Hymenobacter cyanobacteriorum]MCI1190011.1 T9SS type A sorting domain-containing protein [Hymenobacter cyanobacteriorum]
MSTSLPRRLKRAGRLLPIALLSFAAQAQINYYPANAISQAGTYTDLGTTGTAIATANTDDANSAAQPIGFTFTFSGTAFTQFVLNTNGFIKLGATAPSAADLFLPEAPTAPQVDPIYSPNAADVNILAPFNFDLAAGSATGGTEYRVATTGTSPNRVCTIQWKNVADKTLEYDLQYTSMSFQVRLYETSNTIEFVYGPATQGPNPDDYRFAVVGIKGASATNGQTLLAAKAASRDPWGSASFITGYYDGISFFNYRGTVRPDAGRTYRFAAGPVVAITNDEPSGAIALPVATTCSPTTASNIGATTTAPTGYANPGCGVAINPKDVWFKFTTAATGPGSTFVNIQTTGAPAGQLRLFSGASSAGPFTEVGCGAGPDFNTGAGTLSVSSLTPSTTYYIMVSGYGSSDAQGAFTICLTGAAPLAAPAYVALPYAESFEGPWATATSTRDVPTLNWRNTPTTGNSSWRREDDGFAAANWSYEDEETGTAPPYAVAFSAGAHSARFHTYGSASGAQGKLDLYANLSGSGAKTLTFDYINPTGTDKLEVLVSTNGGTTFTAAPVLTLNTAPAFATYSATLPGNSATTVIRFQATSDFGDDDLGIDNLRIAVATATRNATLAAAVSVAPNPAHQRFTVSVTAGSLRAATATLRNALGQPVATRLLNLPAAGGSTDFDVSRLAAGIYTLTLQSGNDLVVKRVVVE